MVQSSKGAEELLTIEQIGSPIRRHRIQKEYLKSLGLGKMRRVREVKNTPEIQGLLKKAKHMVRIIEK
jgi:large subunit ribosomal protein L30